ncbi:hypothetical protein Tco_0711336 [Tanacetum coccineum]
MVSTMTTCNVGRRTAVTRGGGTSEQDGREGERSGDQVVEVAKGVAEVAKEVVKMAKKVIRVVKEVVEEFMACNPKDYDGKDGAIVYTRWIEKMELVQDMNGCGENEKVQTRGQEATIGMTSEDFKTLTREELCPNNEMQKLETEFWCHNMVRDGHAAYTNRFHEFARLVPHLVTPENKRIERYIYGLASQIRVMVVATEPTTIQSVILKARMLTNEVIRNGALKKIFEKRGNNRELSRDGNVRDDNKRSSLEGRLPQSQIML